MPFSFEVREQALVLAARYCCVCRRNRGVRIEVHHIEPEADGGASDLDNAIALCFDCHCDAGHYNARHPKGSKFSKSELRKHRDQWHRNVAEGRIPSASADDSLYTRYLVCKNFSILRRICSGQFDEIPATAPRTVSNSVLVFHNSLLQAYRGGDRPLTVGGAIQGTKEQVTARQGCIVLWDRQGPNGLYFSAVWPPTAEDAGFVEQQDPVTELLLQNEIPPMELFSAGVYGGSECEGWGLQVSYRLRPIWALYLAVTNMDDRLITLQSITGGIDDEIGYEYRSYPDHWTTQSGGTLPLPAAPLPKGATAIIPIGTLLGPLEDALRPASTVWFREESDCKDGATRVFEHGDFSKFAGAVHLIGPHIQPRYLEYVQKDGAVRQDLHDLDLGNLYCLDRYWAGGSCPFLFWRIGKHVATCAGELLDSEPSTLQTVSIQIPANASVVTVAELEQEITILQYISIDGIVQCRNVTLIEGEQLDLPISGGEQLEVRGFYLPVRAHVRTTDPWAKNRSVRRFIAHQSEH